jgi:ATP-dependent Clp protease ATP-binding subunit ClpC
MFEHFTERARKVMQLADQEAQRLNHEYVGTEHLLLGLVKEGSGTGANVLRNLDVDLRKIRNEVEKIVQAGPQMVAKGALPQTPRAKRVIEFAIEEARSLNHNYVGTEHLLLGLLREQEGVAAQVLVNLNLKLEDVREEVLNLLCQGMDPSVENERDAASQASRFITPALDSFGRDLTDLARQGKLDPVISRRSEIERVIQVLSRRTRNNPVLLGEPGVGKTAIVEGLAQAIADGDVPDLLRHRRVVSLDRGLLSSGVKSHGQFEEQLKAVASELHRARNIILYVDDLHALASAGESDAETSNPLKRALARHEIQLITETTPEKYRGYVEKEGALARWFQTIVVDPPSEHESLEILRALRDRYEAHHRVQITDSALEAAIELSRLYLPDEHFPLKAVDLIDEAGARVRSMATIRPPELKEIDEQIERLMQEKEEAVASQDFQRAALLRDQETKLRKKKERITREWQERAREVDGTVDERVIEEVVSRAAGVPLEAVQKRDTTSLPRGMRLWRTSLPEFERLQAESVLRGEGVEIKQGTGFVLLPFRETFHDLFENVIRPAMSDNGIVARKGDNIYEPGSILGQVWTQIRTAEVLVADVSAADLTSNPSPNINVVFELGLCFGLHRCPILLVRDPAVLPFGLRSLRYIQYEDTTDGRARLKAELTRTIGEFLSVSRGSRAET